METRQMGTIEPTANTGTYDTTNTITGVDSSWLLTPADGEGTQPGSATTGEPAKTCANCGTPLTPGAFFCTECGTRVG